MFKKTNKSTKKHFGQGMTEYIIIVAVIAVAAIGVFGYFGQVVKTQIAGVGQELGGVDAEDTRTAAGALSNAAATQAAQENTMTNYHDNNSGEEGVEE